MIEERAIIFDTETTGLIEPVEVVEVAWIVVGPPPEARALGADARRFRPSKPIEFGALATHHIMDEDLVDEPPTASFVLPPAEYLIGHNVDFDWKAAGQSAVRRIDTMAMASAVWPEVGRSSQGALIYMLDRQGARERLRAAHGAVQDVQNCAFVLRSILAVLPGLQTWQGVWNFSEEARIPTVWPFGKHQGSPISETPRDYLAWVLRQPDFDPYLVKAVHRALGANDTAISTKEYSHG